MVFGGVFGEETFAGGGDEGVADVGEGNGGTAAFGGVEDEADAEFVRGAFEAEGYHGCVFVVEGGLVCGRWGGGGREEGPGGGSYRGCRGPWTVILAVCVRGFVGCV